MKKVIVIGCPGSGKSVFSKKLNKITGIPVFHLDMMFWNADGTTVERDIFHGKLSKVLKADEWIIDGNYASTMEMRMRVCDTVFFLDYPTQVCLDGVQQRIGIKHSDLPWLEADSDEEFITFIKQYNTNSRQQVKELLERYSNKEIHVFTSRCEADKFLTRILNDRGAE